MFFRLTTIVFAALLISACAPPPYTNVDNQGLQQLLDSSVTLIDIRRPEEWRETGVVQGSHGLTFVDEAGRLVPGFLERFQAKAPADQPVVLICRTGNRTDVLARHLMEQMGYSQVYNVRNGIVGWMSEGRPVKRPG